MNLNNTFLISDADGTLLTDDKRILPADKAAISELIDAGGMFTIATGRGVSLARVVAEELELQTPAVIFNGAAVYDFKQDKFLWQCFLPPAVKGYMELLKKEFPTLGIEILIGDDIYVTSTNEWEEKHLALGSPDGAWIKQPIRCSFSEVPTEGWIKTLLVDASEVIDEVIKFCAEQGFGDIHMVRSAPIFYEILPKGANKGTGFKKLYELIGIEGRYTVAAGDFMNDIEMLEMADLGVAVANAEDCVKEVADLVVCDNNSGVIREIINYLKLK